MKELSIEQKAKRYDEALEKSKRLYEQGTITESLAYIFPELTESEDERIRKEMISYFKQTNYDNAHTWNGINLNKFVAWLEKQVHVDEDEIVKGIRRGVAISLINHIDANSKGMCLSNMECEDIENAIVNEDWDKVYGYMKKKLEKQGQTFTKKDVDDAYLKGVCDAKQELEKQSEQKPANKVEPKFHEGDWVVSPNGVYWHIDKISNNRYEVTSNTGESSDWNLDTNIYHKFNIQDAEDGDVLATDNGGICIFDGTVEEGKYPFAYCGVIERVFEICDEELPFTHANVQPATKEQRDTLMKAMADAGYEWDAEHKQLKKVKQTSAWSEEDENMLDTIIDASEHHCMLDLNDIDWLKPLKYKVQPKQEWSEEDEKAINDIMWIIEAYRENGFNETHIQMADNSEKWLMSLRPQNKWKPSDEQMKALADALSLAKNCGEEIAFDLRTLYEQLKRLKEE